MAREPGTDGAAPPETVEDGDPPTAISRTVKGSETVSQPVFSGSESPLARLWTECYGAPATSGQGAGGVARQTCGPRSVGRRTVWRNRTMRHVGESRCCRVFHRVWTALWNRSDSGRRRRWWMDRSSCGRHVRMCSGSRSPKRSGCRRSRMSQRSADDGTATHPLGPEPLGEGTHRDPLSRGGASCAGRRRRRRGPSCRSRSSPTPPNPVSSLRTPSPSSASAATTWKPRMAGAGSQGNGGHTTHRRAVDHPLRGRPDDTLNPKYTFDALRHRLVEPLRPRRRADGGRATRPRLQPAVHLRRRRPRQDPPPPGHRPLRPRELPRLPGPVRVERDVPERVRRLDPHRRRRLVQAPLPRRRRAPGRRHPVLRGRGRRRSRSSSTPSTRSTRPTARSCCRAIGRPDDLPTLEDRLRSRFKAGPDHRHPAARPRDPARHPAQEGRDASRRRSPTTCSSSSPRTSPTTSESSRARSPGCRPTPASTTSRCPSNRPNGCLRDLLTDRQPRPITAAADPRGDLEDVRAVAGRAPVKQPHPTLVNARQIAMYVCRELTDLSFPQIAKEFGRSDHTTVIHAVEKIEKHDGREAPDLRPGQRADPTGRATRT